jgi:hypothetical protein
MAAQFTNGIKYEAPEVLVMPSVAASHQQQLIPIKRMSGWQRVELLVAGSGGDTGNIK